MKDKEALKAQVEHIDNRTQWHDKDVKKAESLRNELSAMENGGELTEEAKKKNKVVHKH